MTTLHRSTQLAHGLIVAALLLGACLRLFNLGNVGERTPDEKTYTAQAAALLGEGLPGLRRMAAEYVKDNDYRYLPPPSRIGYTAPVAGLMAATGRSDALIGAWVSCLASIAGLALIAAIGVRFFGPWVGALAALLLATFPPDLVIARRAWSDALVSLLTYLLLYSALLLARRATSWRPALAFLAAGSIFAMTKETSVIVSGLCLVWILASQRRSAIPLAAATVVAGIMSLAFVAWAIGGAAILWDIQSRIGSFHRVNPYGIDYQSGPAWWLLKSFWITSPWTFALALAGLVAAPLFDAWRDRRAVIALAAFVVVMLAIPLALPAWLNLRYSSLASGPIASWPRRPCTRVCACRKHGSRWRRSRRRPFLPASGSRRRGWATIATSIAGSSRPRPPICPCGCCFATAGDEKDLPPPGASPRPPARVDQSRGPAAKALNRSLVHYQQGWGLCDEAGKTAQAIAFAPRDSGGSGSGLPFFGRRPGIVGDS
ncbi:MAG: glycosyltransferase family 39 protein [Betaproteobacteria bacterium]|nr:glycosyltransferase family 39 protein [Betaproteobacteria bacterium]